MTRSPNAHVAVYVAIIAVCIELSTSANLLTWLGVSYVADGGNVLVKLHPGTDLLLLATAILCLQGAGWRALAGDWPLLGFLIGMAACLAYLMTLTGSGHVVVLLDTFLPAGLLAWVVGQATPQQLAMLRRSMQALFAIGAALALVETAFHATLIPLYLNDAAYHPHSEDFRATALYDHPLTGAVMMMLGLALLPARGVCRLVYGALLSAALLSFGGRTAVVIMLLMASASWAVPTWRLILARDVRAFTKLMTSAAIVLGALPILAGALAAGLGTRIIEHLYWDDSAQVRLAQWQLVEQLDRWQFVFGARRQDLLAILTPLWLGSGVEVIENFWLLMFVAFGIVGFPLFAGSLLLLLVWCWRRSTLRGRLLVVGVMLVASTSNSLGRKSTILVCMIATIACLAVDPCRIGLSRRETISSQRRLAKELVAS